MKRKLTTLAIISVIFVTGCAGIKQTESRIVKTVEVSDNTMIFSFEAHDGVIFDGKLRLPEGPLPEYIVVFVNGSGPNTFDNRRKAGEIEFRYFDLFEQQILRAGAGFFSCNTRGVTPGENPPLYADIDYETYRTYTPQNEILDTELVLTELKKLPGFEKTRFILLGWSSGTIIAPAVAAENDTDIAALILAGYVNATMRETLEWQLSGKSSMVFYKRYFDYDKNGTVSEEELAEDRYGLSGYLGAGFSDLDLDNDSGITEKDFYILLSEYRKSVFNAVDNSDGEWLKKNYGVLLTPEWFKSYESIYANSITMLQVETPVFILHGEFDSNVPASGVMEISEAYAAAGKNNLEYRIFAGHDHDLNYSEYITRGTISEGLSFLFDTVERIVTEK